MSINSVSSALNAAVQNVQGNKHSAGSQATGAIRAAVEEATETHAQTAKEAANGDAQARRLLQKQSVQPTQSTVGNLVNVKA